MSELEEYLDFAKGLAQEAGKTMSKYFSSKELEIELKDDLTRVTVADKKINDFVIKEIEKRFPDHTVLGEEASKQTKSDYLWVCDPIDGTLPYSLGLPISSFNLALVHNGHTVVAVQLDPFTNRLLYARKNGGSYLNGNKLRMSGKLLGKHTINCEIYSNEYNSIFSSPDAEKEIWESLKLEGFVLMKLISTANSVGLVATGELAGSIFSNSHIYEAATVSLLVTEAGGSFTSLFGDIETFGGKINGFIAAPNNIHLQLLSIVKPIAQKYKQR